MLHNHSFRFILICATISQLCTLTSCMPEPKEPVIIVTNYISAGDSGSITYDVYKDNTLITQDTLEVTHTTPLELVVKQQSSYTKPDGTTITCEPITNITLSVTTDTIYVEKYSDLAPLFRHELSSQMHLTAHTTEADDFDYIYHCDTIYSQYNNLDFTILSNAETYRYESHIETIESENIKYNYKVEMPYIVANNWGVGLTSVTPKAGDPNNTYEVSQEITLHLTPRSTSFEDTTNTPINIVAKYIGIVTGK